MTDLLDGVTILRELPAGGQAFALNSWLKSYEPRARRLHELGRNEYYRTYHPELSRLLRLSNVALAVLDDDPDCYLGWACGSEGVLHWVYVKHAYRELGVARALVREVAGDGVGVFTFEPSTSSGEPRKSLLAVAERKGMKHHAHPIPGVVVRSQLKAKEPA
jgi:GNAT superfamily N-acetyltransferase